MQQQAKISSTLFNLNNSTQVLNENNKILNENIAKFEKYMEYSAFFQEEMTFENDVNEHLITLIEMTDEIQNTLNKCVDSCNEVTFLFVSRFPSNRIK